MKTLSLRKQYLTKCSRGSGYAEVARNNGSQMIQGTFKNDEEESLKALMNVSYQHTNTITQAYGKLSLAVTKDMVLPDKIS